MYKKFALFISLFFFFSNAKSQISAGGTPESFGVRTKSAVVIPAKVLNAIDSSSLIREDVKMGIPNRYGVVQQTDIDVITEGVKTEIVGKGYCWRYEINSPQAYSIGISFGKYHIPEGSSVFIYNEAHTDVLGSFTSLNNNSLNQLTIADFIGQNAIVEYFEPYNPSFSGQLAIASVSQAYTNPLKAAVVRVGVNCTEGDGWQDAKHAVCRMTFHDSQYSYYCTGFLVNNVREDGTPYFQTANHCISASSEASTLVTYFNYENSTCSSSDASAKQTLSGSTLKATSTYNDFTLLLLTEYPPTTYFPFYAGWDASTRSPLKGTGIHHPQGTPKCIALASIAPVTYSKQVQWTGDNTATITTAADTHWEVQFDDGSTEEGSSGSPLFDDNQHVIGQLHGGSSTYDLYGKFSLSWNHSSVSSAQLKCWLDPDNSGTLSLDGTYMKMKPKASFQTSFTQICPKAAIIFTDNSKYTPTSWNWTVQPSSYSFANGTSQSAKNPEIIFNEAGTYTVSLTVANANGADSITKTNYINAGSISVKLSGITADSVVCGCSLTNYPLAVSGATNYSFSVERSDKINYSFANDSAYLSLIDSEKKNGSFNSWFKVVGTQGTCSNSDSLELKISMPVNDYVENAIQLKPGRNTSYTNVCASAETNEVAPWSAAITNSIWFKFQAPSNGKVSIDTHGFNDRIAVYDASTSADLISGKAASYSLVSTNDNRSSSDNTAYISNITVIPYKTYWLQVDGSASATGACVIDLLSNSLEIYPNPTTGAFTAIISNLEDGNADFKIVSLLGQVLLTKQLSVTKENNQFEFDISAYPSGVYLVVVTINGVAMQKKLSLIKK